MCDSLGRLRVSLKGLERAPITPRITLLSTYFSFKIVDDGAVGGERSGVPLDDGAQQTIK